MLDKYNYHHNKYSYHAINRVIIIASHGLRAGQLRETVWHSQGLVWEPFAVLGPIPNKVYWLCKYKLGLWLLESYKKNYWL